MSELRTGYRVPGCGPARTSRRPSPGLPHAPPRAAPGRHPLPGRGEARGPRAPPRRQFRAPPEGAAGPGATRGRRPRPGRGVRRGGAAAGAAPGPPPPPRPPPWPQAPPSGPGRRSSPEVCGAAGAEAMWLLWLLLGSAGECGRGPSRGAARRRGGVLGAAGEGAGPHVRPRLPAAPGGPGRGPPASPPLLSPPSPPLRFPTSGRAEAAGACGRPGLPSGRARAGGGGEAVPCLAAGEEPLGRGSGPAELPHLVWGAGWAAPLTRPLVNFYAPAVGVCQSRRAAGVRCSDAAGVSWCCRSVLAGTYPQSVGSRLGAAACTGNRSVLMDR